MILIFLDILLIWTFLARGMVGPVRFFIFWIGLTFTFQIAKDTWVVKSLCEALESLEGSQSWCFSFRTSVRPSPLGNRQISSDRADFFFVRSGILSSWVEKVAHDDQVGPIDQAEVITGF